jgi:hypothetical protein
MKATGAYRKNRSHMMNEPVMIATIAPNPWNASHIDNLRCFNAVYRRRSSGGFGFARPNIP